MNQPDNRNNTSSEEWSDGTTTSRRSSPSTAETIEFPAVNIHGDRVYHQNDDIYLNQEEGVGAELNDNIYYGDEMPDYEFDEFSGTKEIECYTLNSLAGFYHSMEKSLPEDEIEGYKYVSIEDHLTILQKNGEMSEAIKWQDKELRESRITLGTLKREISLAEAELSEKDAALRSSQVRVEEFRSSEESARNKANALEQELENKLAAESRKENGSTIKNIVLISLLIVSSVLAGYFAYKYFGIDQTHSVSVQKEKEYQQQIKELKSALDSQKDKLSDVSNNNSTKQAAIDELKSKLDEATKSAADSVKILKDRDDEIKQLNDQIDELSNKTPETVTKTVIQRQQPQTVTQTQNQVQTQVQTQTVTQTQTVNPSNLFDN